MAVQFKESGVVLFSASGSVAMDPNCCCGGLDPICCNNTVNQFEVLAEDDTENCCLEVVGTYFPTLTDDCEYSYTAIINDESESFTCDDGLSCYEEEYVLSPFGTFREYFQLISVTFSLLLSDGVNLTPPNKMRLNTQVKYKRCQKNLSTGVCSATSTITQNGVSVFSEECFGDLLFDISIAPNVLDPRSSVRWCIGTDISNRLRLRIS